MNTAVEHCAPLQLSAQSELWEEVRHVELSVDVGQAELFLQRHSDSVLHMHNCVFDVMQMGHDLTQVIMHASSQHFSLHNYTCI